MVWFSMDSVSSDHAVASDMVYRLHALQRGSMFPKEPFTCRVHSVYPHAVNLNISER